MTNGNFPLQYRPNILQSFIEPPKKAAVNPMNPYNSNIPLDNPCVKGLRQLTLVTGIFTIFLVEEACPREFLHMTPTQTLKGTSIVIAIAIAIKMIISNEISRNTNSSCCCSNPAQNQEKSLPTRLGIARLRTATRMRGRDLGRLRTTEDKRPTVNHKDPNLKQDCA